MSDLQGVAEAAIRMPLRSRPAPRVAIRQTETGQAIEPILDEAANLEDFHALFLDAFGTTEQIIAEVLFEQLVNALHGDPTKALDAATANLVLALLQGRIEPGSSVLAERVDRLEARGATWDHGVSYFSRGCSWSRLQNSRMSRSARSLGDAEYSDLPGETEPDGAGG